jgi:hypothetical protein
MSNKENDLNNSNRQSTLDTNKNSILFFSKGNYFSFGKDNIIDNKLAPNTSCFNIRDSFKKPIDMSLNNNSFLNKKRKLMTSEELELEQIQREREEVKKMMKKNMDLYNRTKSGTTTIVSKVRETIYGLNNLSKSNDNMNNNVINKNNSYSMNSLREKALNKINQLNKKINENNMKNIHQPNIYKGKTIEIINTDILPKNNPIINNEKENKNEKVIELNENEESVEQMNEKELIPNQENTIKKTPNKENSYLNKIQQLGSMSKLSLYNKIEKYTEICQEVLKEQENGKEESNQANNEKQKSKKKKKKNSKK